MERSNRIPMEIFRLNTSIPLASLKHMTVKCHSLRAKTANCHVMERFWQFEGDSAVICLNLVGLCVFMSVVLSSLNCVDAL